VNDCLSPDEVFVILARWPGLILTNIGYGGWRLGLRHGLVAGFQGSNMASSCGNRTDSLPLYDYVRSQLTTLIQRFGLEASGADILCCYQTICKESLAFAVDRKPPEFSRINEDGTPFQFALTLGPHHPILQFLSEAGIPGSSGVERIARNRDCIRTLGGVLRCAEAVAEVGQLLDEMAPVTDHDLLADPAGAFWTGVGFARGERPQLKIYINARWGHRDGRWKRLHRFASHFGIVEERWQALDRSLVSNMEPLGMALTLGETAPLAGRIYLTAYGKPLSYYERLMQPVTDEAFRGAFRRYTEFILGEDRTYPTRSVVCSFGFGSRAELDFKFELCGHCVFASDLEAAGRLRSWLDSTAVDPAPYVELINVLSECRLSASHAHLHSYTGVGVKEHAAYTSLYLKPKKIRSQEMQ
jgi:hypothetical protein